MKINNLLEGITAASDPANATSAAPKFGRSDKFLEEKDEAVEESTTSGSVSSVASPVGGMQRRGKGSMLQGIKSSSKYPNSKAVKESQINEVDPHRFDSDVDYYAAKNAPARSTYRGTSSPGVNPDDEDYFREIFRKKRLAAQKAEREADHERLATGTNESAGSDSELKSWQVVIFNNYYRGKYSDYSGRYYYVLASSPEEAKQVVIDNADGILQDLLSMKSHNGKKILPRGSAVRITPERIGKIEDGTVEGRMSTAGYKKMFGPQGLMMAKLSGGAVVDIQGQEQTVDEASFDYTMKDLGNDYAGFPSNHSLKHKFLARIKPEKQQLYKDKMNNMQGFDQLIQLFNVAKQRGDIVDQEVAEAGNPVDTDWYRKQQERQTRAKQRQDRQQQSVEEGYPKHQDLSGISTDRLKAYVKKVSGGGVPQFGAGAQLKRVQQELKRREQGVAEETNAPIKYRATVEYGPTAADAHFVTVTANSTEEAEAKVQKWCEKKGVQNPMITINGADKPIAEKSKSQAQFRTMAAVAHNPKFAKKVGISQKVGKEFHSADKGSDYKKLPKRAQSEVEEGVTDTIKQGAKKAWDWATEPTHQAHDIIVKDRAKNIAKIRKQEAKKSVLEKDPEAMREFERSGGYKAGLDIMGWQVGWAAASNAKSTDTAKEAFQKLYYGGGSPFPFDIKSFKLAWVAYKKHHGPQANLEEAEFTEDKLASDLYKDFQIFKKGADKDIGSKAKDKEIGNKPQDKDIVAKEDCWKGYTQYGMKDKGGKKVPNCVPVTEMDKSQPAHGRDGDINDDAGKKEFYGKPVTAKKVAKDALSTLNKEMSKSKKK